MSLENNQTQFDGKNMNTKKETQINIINPEQSLLFKPIPIKQNTLNKNPNINIENNNFPNPPTPIHQNSFQNQYINENNKINLIKIHEQENPQYINNTLDLTKNFPNDKAGAFSFFNRNNSNTLNNINTNVNNTINTDINNLQNSKVHCTCKKTKCIKKYCECFSSGNKCFNCKCQNCENRPYYVGNISNKKKESENNENIENFELNEDNEEKLIICTCSKSGCNKNYCECFKAKVKCNNKCRCIKCLNKIEENNNEFEEPKIIMRSKSTPINFPSNINNNIPETNNNNNNNNQLEIANNFTVHRISVLINKAQTIINTEKLDSYDSLKFLNKKRNMK